MKSQREDNLLAGIRMVIRLARIAQQVCEQWGLTLPQYRSLYKIAHTRHRAHEIAQVTAVSRPAVTALTAGLQRLKLIESIVDEVDKRGIYFVATAEGKKILAEVERKLVARFAEVLGDSAKALASFTDIAAIEGALDRQVKREFGSPGALLPADFVKAGTSREAGEKRPRRRTARVRARS